MNLMVEARMNDTDIKMLIDNGVMWDEILFYGSDLVDGLGNKCQDTHVFRETKDKCQDTHVFRNKSQDTHVFSSRENSAKVRTPTSLAAGKIQDIHVFKEVGKDTHCFFD
jgi:hypothetical protein